MPIVTVQLGQCGNQLGGKLFQTLAAELSTGCDYDDAGVDEFFRPRNDCPTSEHSGAEGRHVARAVLIDMEPKVVQAALSTAASSGGWWCYGSSNWLVQQSGAGNNWAQGYHGFGPRVRDDALELVRREAEACDLMGGFVLLQSMAGGTGAGLGTYVAQALRDEYHNSYIVNACVGPYDSGEVIVQAYNTLLTLSHLADVSDGLVLLQNEALHRICNKLHNIARPSFNDMNSVGAQALASILLPSNHRPASSSANPPGRSPRAASAGRAASPNFETGHRSAPGVATTPRPGAAPPRPVHLLSDVVTHLCCHPWYRILTLRAVPQMPTTSIDFTTFTWPSITRRLRQMLITGSAVEEGMDWHVSTPSSSPGLPPTPTGRNINRSLANWLVLRGQAAGEVDVSEFGDAGLYPSWSAEPLMVSSHPAKFARCSMAATLLSNDQTCVEPVRRMQERAYAMLASRAFVHQYENHGLQMSDFTECMSHVEDLTARYAAL